MLLVFGGPIVFGLLCGYPLGHSKTAYLLASLLTIPGAFLAGFEHAGASEGLPHPAVVLVLFTALIGTLLGAFGGAARSWAEQRAQMA